MYIPRPEVPISATPPGPDNALRTGQSLLRESAGSTPDSALSSVRPPFTRVLDAIPTTLKSASSLQRRDAAAQNNAMIGAVVGVLLSVFLIGSCAFCYYYRDSIRQAQRKRYRRRRKSRGSKSSKSSKGSDGSGQPPPAA